MSSPISATNQTPRGWPTGFAAAGVVPLRLAVMHGLLPTLPRRRPSEHASAARSMGRAQPRLANQALAASSSPWPELDRPLEALERAGPSAEVDSGRLRHLEREADVLRRVLERERGRRSRRSRIFSPFRCAYGESIGRPSIASRNQSRVDAERLRERERLGEVLDQVHDPEVDRQLQPRAGARARRPATSPGSRSRRRAPPAGRAPAARTSSSPASACGCEPSTGASRKRGVPRGEAGRCRRRRRSTSGSRACSGSSSGTTAVDRRAVGEHRDHDLRALDRLGGRVGDRRAEPLGLLARAVPGRAPRGPRRRGCGRSGRP